MISADRNDLVPSQKLEWVTPKISLMEAGDTEGGKYFDTSKEKTFSIGGGNTTKGGPS